MATQVRIEGERIAHLATKADIAALGAKLDALLEPIRAKLNTLMWILGIVIPAAIAITGIVVGIVVQMLNSLPG